MTPVPRFLRPCAQCGKRIIAIRRATTFMHAWKDEPVRDAAVHYRCAQDYLNGAGAGWVRLAQHLMAQPGAIITETT